MGVLLSPQDFAGSIAGPPATGAVRVGGRTLAGGDFLAMRAAQGIERLVQPMLGRTAVAVWFGTGGSALNPIGVLAPTTVGTATTRPPSAAAVMATRSKRTGYVSAATAGALASIYGTTGLVAPGSGAGIGGFLAVFRFVIADAATVSGARMFVGLSATLSAPTNVEPSTLTNSIGIAQLSTSGNLQIVFGGSAAQPPVDLGAGFPANGGSSDLYELILFSDPVDATKIGWRVERLNTGTVAEGSLANTVPGTTLPSATTILAMRHWRTNNATALAVAIDLVAAMVAWDF
jgi:hypothetical protein